MCFLLTVLSVKSQETEGSPVVTGDHHDSQKPSYQLPFTLKRRCQQNVVLHFAYPSDSIDGQPAAIAGFCYMKLKKGGK